MHQNAKGPVTNGDRTFYFIASRGQAALDTRTSLSMSSVPIK